MDCEEILRALNEFVDGEGVSPICEEFAKHLQGCDPCKVVVDNIRQTIQVFRGDKEVPLPVEFQKMLQDFLRSHWEKKWGLGSASQLEPSP